MRVQGLPTRAQLAARWQDVSRATRQLSYIPSGGGGMFSIALAGVAARLKVCQPFLAMSLCDIGCMLHVKACLYRVLLAGQQPSRACSRPPVTASI